MSGGCTFGSASSESFFSGTCESLAEVRVDAEDPEKIWPESLAGDMCMKHGKLIESRAEEMSRGKVSIKLRPLRNRGKG